MKLLASASAVVVAFSAGIAFAQTPSAPRSGQTLITSQGPAIVTGSWGGGGVQTAIMPGGSQGVVTSNGNNTSTIMTPDGQITTVPSAR